MSYVCDIKQKGMTYKKSEAFEPELRELAAIARVLSHPARIAILKYLASCRTCISGDISSEIPLSRTTVSQHLQELKQAGMIKGEISGVKVNYCLDTEKLDHIQKIFRSMFSEICCGHKYNCK